MYSVVFSSRHNPSIRPENPLFDLLESFQNNTTQEEKDLSEFLIKFDGDDPNIPSDESLERYDFKVQKFVWERHAGRLSLHTVQDCLYKRVDKNCKFVQFISDDFIFCRPDFVSQILEFSDRYKITGEPGLPPIANPGADIMMGYAPAFSTKVLDALSYTTGPSCNIDGLGWMLAEEMRKLIGYELMFSPGALDESSSADIYYKRTDISSSGLVRSDLFFQMTEPESAGDSKKGYAPTFWATLAKNVAISMLSEDIGDIQDLVWVAAHMKAINELRGGKHN